MTLYEITEAFAQLQHELEEADGELTPELEEALQVGQEELQQKADGYYRIIRNLKAEEEALAGEIKRLQARKKKIGNNVERLKSAVKTAMQVAGQKKIDTSIGSFGLRSTQKCECIDFEQATDRHKRIKVEPDLETAKRDLKEGKLVPGFQLVSDNSLTVR